MAVSGAHQVAAKDYPKIGTQFADSRWPDLRISGLAYVQIATKLLTTHAYEGETVWFYERLSAACAEHRRALPFWPGWPCASRSRPLSPWERTPALRRGERTSGRCAHAPLKTREAAHRSTLPSPGGLPRMRQISPVY